MTALLAALLTAQLLGQDVGLTLRADPPRPWQTLERVEVAVRGCRVSSTHAGPGWTPSLAYRDGEVWYIFTRSEGWASPLPDRFLTFHGCRPAVKLAWLWWRDRDPYYGDHWQAECYGVGIEYRGYRPAPLGPREPPDLWGE